LEKQLRRALVTHDVYEKQATSAESERAASRHLIDKEEVPESAKAEKEDN
jgi:hypothetical protein